MKLENTQLGSYVEKASKRMNLFIVLTMLLPIYLKFMDVISQIIPFSTSITTYIYYGFLWVLIIMALPRLFFENINKIVIVFSFVFFIVMLNMWFFPSSVEFIFDDDIERLITFQTSTLLPSTFFLMIGLVVMDIEHLVELIHRVAKFGILLATCSYCLMLIKGIDIHYDDMNHAYAIGLLVCLMISNGNKRDIIYIICGTACLIIAGTRGPILCVVTSLLCTLVIFKKNFYKKVIGAFFCVIVVLVIYHGVGLSILESFSKFLANFGMKNLRILDYAKGEMLFDSSGRDEYINLLVDAIKARPFVGYGIGGDRGILAEGSYAHNIIIECLISLGVIGGTIFITWLLIISIKVLTSENIAIRKLGIGLFCGVVVKLMLSSSLILSKEFFLFLGMCIASKRLNASENNNSLINTTSFCQKSKT